MLDVLRTWHDFFFMCGGASATLLGLVFISVAMVNGLPELPAEEMRHIFVTPVLAQFAYAFGLSALCLVPFTSATAFGLVGAIPAGAAVVQAGSVVVAVHRQYKVGGIAPSAGIGAMAYAPFVAALVAFGSAVAIAAGHLGMVAGIAVAVAVLDLLALLNAWRLLIWILFEHRKIAKPDSQR